MSGSFRHFTLAFLFLFIILGLILPGESIQAQEADPSVLIIGSVKDQQEQPVVDARVMLVIDGENDPLAEATT